MSFSFWNTGEIIPYVSLYLDISDTTIVSQSGSETLHDRVLGDGFDNSMVVDWDYSPSFGYLKPVFTGGSYFSGPLGGYMSPGSVSIPNSGSAPTNNFIQEAKLSLSGSAVNSNICPIFYSVSSGFSFLVGMAIKQDAQLQVAVKVNSTYGTWVNIDTLIHVFKVEVVDHGSTFDAILYVDNVAISSIIGFSGSMLFPGNTRPWPTPTDVQVDSRATVMNYYYYKLYSVDI